MNHNQKRGFTLLELLITISIIAILSLIIIFILNPAETLKKSRDAQRIADLSTLKTALGLYLTASSTPDLDGTGGTFLCLSGSNATARIGYSAEIADATCTTNPDEGTDTSATFAADACYSVSSGAGNIDGTGWMPVNLTTLTGGSPISNLPLDPINTIGTATAPSSTDLVYRYACQGTGASGKPSLVFEFNAQLESDEYTSVDNKRAKDGGDNSNYYEVGTSLKLLGETGTAY